MIGDLIQFFRALLEAARPLPPPDKGGHLIAFSLDGANADTQPINFRGFGEFVASVDCYLLIMSGDKTAATADHFGPIAAGDRVPFYIPNDGDTWWISAYATANGSAKARKA